MFIHPRIPENLISLSEQDSKTITDTELSYITRCNTQAIQETIVQASLGNGSNCVLIPSGRYSVTTLVLYSTVTLYLTREAMLVASPTYEEYPQVEQKRPCKMDTDYNHRCLIFAQDAHNIALFGPGTIDGSALAFWDSSLRDLRLLNQDTSYHELEKTREDDSPFKRAKKQRISPLVFFDHCSQISIEDITLTNASGWTVHMRCCEQLTIRHIQIKNDLYGPNTDGLDINGCRDVMVSQCNIRGGDDAIIIKATEDAQSSENIIVSDCIIETNCAAFGIGAEVVHPIRNISVRNLVVKRALRLIQIELWDASIVENVTIDGIVGSNMTDIPLERPIYLDIQSHGRTDSKLGKIRNIQISHISAVTRGRCLLTAKDGACIEQVQINNIQLMYLQVEDPKVSVPSSKSNQMSNDNPHTRSERAVFVCDNVKNLILRDVQVTWPESIKEDDSAWLKEDLDRGQLFHDYRKRAALASGEHCVMDGVLLRNCTDCMLDITHLQRTGGRTIHHMEEQ